MKNAERLIRLRWLMTDGWMTSLSRPWKHAEHSCRLYKNRDMMRPYGYYRQFMALGVYIIVNVN